jgi:FkbM family methyltransferase
MWDRLRPIYDRLVNVAGRGGLERVINGTDAILISPRFRNLTETYEKDVWRSLMGELHPGNVFADVGVYIGLYTVAVARRVGTAGHVYGFEPDPVSYGHALEHIKLNSLQDHVTLIHAAVGESDKPVFFKFAAESGHIATSKDNDVTKVDCVRLDQFFSDEKLDILKIDVEGFEEEVLKGAVGLLKEMSRCPRAIYIEVHPYAWSEIGTTSESLLNLLHECGYEVEQLDGQSVATIEHYGEIIARKKVSACDLK